MSFTYQSLDPVPVTKPTERNLRDSRTFQGIPGIAVLPSGRIFAVWYAGGHTEFTENFVMMVISDDNGETWSDAVAVVDPPSPDVRAFDSTFWIAPDDDSSGSGRNPATGSTASPESGIPFLRIRKRIPRSSASRRRSVSPTEL